LSERKFAETLLLRRLTGELSSVVVRNSELRVSLERKNPLPGVAASVGWRRDCSCSTRQPEGLATPARVSPESPSPQSRSRKRRRSCPLGKATTVVWRRRWLSSQRQRPERKISPH